MINEYRQIIHESMLPCTPPEYSFARILQALPELPPVDIYINDNVRAINFKYKDITPYIPSFGEVNNVKVFLTGTKDKPLVEISNLEIPKGQIITFAAYGSVDDLKVTQIVDDINETVAPDETKIRFYNLDGAPISFSFDKPNEGISRSLSSNEGTDYIEVNPGQHRFEVRLSNPNVRPISMMLNLRPGRIYTLYITGSMDPLSIGYIQGNIPQIILVSDGNSLLTKCSFVF